MPIEVVKWNLAEKFNWTLDYINTLSVEDYHVWQAIVKGRTEALEVINEWKNS